jgi:hypothetical protein
MPVRVADTEVRMRELSGLVLSVVAALAVAACDATTPTSSIRPSGTPSLFADRPAVQIDGTWTALNGRWTFTGSVDPEGSPTDVVLDVGPGPSRLRQFESHVPVAQALLAAGPLTITTQAIPDIPVICVRFTATNQAGASFTTPLCFPHDLPTPGPPGAPVVRIDGPPSQANGEWSFTAYVDPKNAPTDVILEIGTGPTTFTKQVSVAKGSLVAATLQVATADIPASGEACVRFTATNSVGTTSSAPLCFSPTSPSPSAP